VNWAGGKLGGMIVLMAVALLGGQLFLTSSATASAMPTGCHEHPHSPHRPASHQCCAVAHRPLMVQTYSSGQSWHEFSTDFAIAPHLRDQSGRRMTFLLPISSTFFPPTPLRV